LLEKELVKVASFYINKQEPLLAENDMRNTFPAVDRLEILGEAMEQEVSF
jgi:hypothetical protein